MPLIREDDDSILFELAKTLDDLEKRWVEILLSQETLNSPSQCGAASGRVNAYREVKQLLVDLKEEYLNEKYEDKQWM